MLSSRPGRPSIETGVQMKSLLDALRKYGWIVVVISSATVAWVMMQTKVESHSEKIKDMEDSIKVLERESVRQEEINKSIDKLERSLNRRNGVSR